MEEQLQVILTGRAVSFPALSLKYSVANVKLLIHFFLQIVLAVLLVPVHSLTAFDLFFLFLFVICASGFAVRLPRSDNLSFMPAYPEEEPSQSLEEMEAQTIGNLLPDEDDFFAGVVGHKSRANGGDDLDDCDLFSSVGGMELDGDVFSSVGQRAGKRGGSNVFGVGEPPRGEVSSRMLFVTNMDSIIEDYELRALFKVRIFTCLSDCIILIYGTRCCF